ncbi:hypothetical protein CPB85DRAFT_1356276 [Mucidula mucida]|nr:hypothetical protein CPB85DRAFT_1356276 [Mucidula mucida]
MAPHCMPESDEKAQDMVEEAFGVRPCLWQLKVVRAILEGKDVVTIAPMVFVCTTFDTCYSGGIAYYEDDWHFV